MLCQSTISTSERKRALRGPATAHAMRDISGITLTKTFHPRPCSSFQPHSVSYIDKRSLHSTSEKSGTLILGAQTSGLSRADSAWSRPGSSHGIRRRIRGARLARDRTHIFSFLNYVSFLPFEATPDDMRHGLNYPPRSGPLLHNCNVILPAQPQLTNASCL